MKTSEGTTDLWFETQTQNQIWSRVPVTVLQYFIEFVINDYPIQMKFANNPIIII